MGVSVYCFFRKVFLIPFYSVNFNSFIIILFIFYTYTILLDVTKLVIVLDQYKPCNNHNYEVTNFSGERLLKSIESSFISLFHSLSFIRQISCLVCFSKNTACAKKITIHVVYTDVKDYM